MLLQRSHVARHVSPRPRCHRHVQCLTRGTQFSNANVLMLVQNANGIAEAFRKGFFKDSIHSQLHSGNVDSQMMTMDVESTEGQEQHRAVQLWTLSPWSGAGHLRCPVLCNHNKTSRTRSCGGKTLIETQTIDTETHGGQSLEHGSI